MNANATCRTEFERSYNYLRLVAACSKIARPNVKDLTAPIGSTPSTEEKIRASFTLSMHSSVHFAEVSDRRTSITTLHVSVVCIS